ncbi:MAG TPA: flagellar motor protein MotB [Cerasibacillus sp.]|uniref:flagellar motor protein MotB n=1 Tax=Cerasibacillus sp. TaxID=2498711 RepID=UPI002F41C095
MKRKNKNQDYQADQSWLLPYADLLTLLLALFIVLFAMSEIDAKKYEELAQVFKSEFSNGRGPLNETISTTVNEPENQEKETPDEENQDSKEENDQTENRSSIELQQLKDMQQNINRYIHKNDLEESIDTILTNEGLMITILTDVTFATGSAEVNTKGVKIAKEISTFFEIDPPHQIVVSGHADDRPISNEEFDSNWELSVIRAVNFMKIILQNDKLNPIFFSSKGYGDNHPIVPNISDKNRAKNRRVEVLILPNYKIDTEKG